MNFLSAKYLFKFLNLSMLKPINEAGNIPASESTEYLPSIKLLYSIIPASNLFAILIKLLSLSSVIIINLFFNKNFLGIDFKLATVSRVFPDFEITT